MPAKTTYNHQSPSRNKFYIIGGIVILILSVVLVAFNFLGNQSPTEVDYISPAKQTQTFDTNNKEETPYDFDGAVATRKLQRSGINMGFVWSNLPSSVENLDFPFQPSEQDKETIKRFVKQPVSLDELISVPESPTKANLLEWEQYSITAPIQYARFDEIFSDLEGETFAEFVDNNPIDSPVQLKLRDGIVHLPFTPSPGEIGNSYIIGHSSNYQNVKSDYNEILKPIIKKVTVGETFKIYDYLGRELTFEVIETKVVGESDTKEAYKLYGDKRVVTLQGSILENVDGEWLPTKRYLVIAELVDPQENISNQPV